MKPYADMDINELIVELLLWAGQNQQFGLSAGVRFAGRVMLFTQRACYEIAEDAA